jgi:RarD protein
MAGATTAQSYGKGVTMALVGAACWSLGGGLVRMTEDADAWQIIFYRSLTVFVLTLAWLFWRKGPATANAFASGGMVAVLAGVAIGVAGLLFVVALFYTTVAQVIFMTGIAPFSAALLARLFLKERTTRATWTAMTIALVGLVVMLFAEPGAVSIAGTALAMLSAFFFSVYSVMIRTRPGADMTVAVVWNALFLLALTSLVMLVPTPLREGFGLSQFAIGWENYFWIFIMGAVQLTLGLILFTTASRSVPSAQLALLALVEPTLAPVWAWLASGELPPVSTFAGGAIIMLAIVFLVVANSGRLSRRPTEGGSR